MAVVITISSSGRSPTEPAVAVRNSMGSVGDRPELLLKFKLTEAA